MLIYILESILTHKIFLNLLLCKIKKKKKDAHGIIVDAIFFFRNISKKKIDPKYLNIHILASPILTCMLFRVAMHYQE